MSVQIGIIGPEQKNIKNKKIILMAKEIGRCIASKNAVLITGGCSGVSQVA